MSDELTTLLGNQSLTLETFESSKFEPEPLPRSTA